MKKTSKRLEIVLKLAEIRERQAAEQLAQAIDAERRQQQQIQQLQSFQQEYSAQFTAMGKNGASAQQLQNFQRFYNNLETVVDTQHQQAQSTAMQKDAARANWQQHYSRQKNMQSLVERKRQEEDREFEKLVQREHDDRKLHKP